MIAIQLPSNPLTFRVKTLHPIVRSIIGNIEHLFGQGFSTFTLGCRVLVAELCVPGDPSKHCRLIRHFFITTDRAKRITLCQS